MTVAYYPYTIGPFVGQVNRGCGAGRAGSAIAITLEERRTP